MNKAKLLSFSVIALLIINLVTLSVLFSMFLSKKGEEHGPRGEGPKRLIIARLGFDEKQQDAYELLIDNHRKNTDILRRESQHLHEELYSLLKQKNIIQPEVDSLMNLISANQKAIDKVNFDHFRKIKDLCKGEQVEKFDELAGELARLFGPPGPPR